ncbi:hypothetical protein LWC34_10805 [Kibdelosporangium philippinense]|uniref:DUF3311 domain-containing protein n=2 Tax=Kibdelosporangium philippinense TaxID=211113 RepID=A0ABS8ZBW6_9PSEU|nr:hypothetical protein [Kibdelosporangium philippinense]MCE7003312.1 hypothetical protein [Kibdelosporangium philippinense]
MRRDKKRPSRPVTGGRLATGLAVVAVFGFVLLMPPLLSAFNTGGQIFGLPVIWVYLFVVWAVIIGVIAVLVGKSG